MKIIIKKIFSYFTLLLLFVIVFGVGYYVGNNKINKPESVILDNNKTDLKLPGEIEKRVVTVEEVETKLLEIGELSTYSEEYKIKLSKEETRYLLEKIKMPWTTNSIELECKGVVKVGYELSEISVKVDDNKIYISIPKAKLNDNYVIWDSIEYKEKNNINNPIEFSQYHEMVQEIEEKGLKEAENKGIYNAAEDNLKKLITEFLSGFVGYTIVYM